MKPNSASSNHWVGLMQTLKAIRSTDPRFSWLASDLGWEEDPRVDLATLIDDSFRQLQDGKDALLDHLNAMIQDMHSLNPVEELFDILTPTVPDMRERSVLLRRMGWSGEYWYTEYEASIALGLSISAVRFERAKLVRVLRRGPVWVPALRRCAAVLQELAPITQTQFRAACGIDLDGPWTMTLWGFLNALDQFGVDHWFFLEYPNREPVLHYDLRTDFSYDRAHLDNLVEQAELRIAREIAKQRRIRREERLERQKYHDPWEMRPYRKSRETDVGFREHEVLHWTDFPRDSELFNSPDFNDLAYGRRLYFSEAASESEPQPSLVDDAGDDQPLTDETSISTPLPSVAESIPDVATAESDNVEDSDPGLDEELIDLSSLMSEELFGHYTGPIDEGVLRELEAGGHRWAPIIDRETDLCLGVIKTSRLSNKLRAGSPVIRRNDPKIIGTCVNRFLTESQLRSILRVSRVVYFNDDPEVWGVVFREDLESL